jgi:RNA polymerase sigma-70 factor (ECF subfamily)
MTVPTAELIRRYQAGQIDIFEAIFDRYKDYVYRVAFSLTQHVEEAEEVVQEAFLDVLKALPRYRVEGPARFETWLYRVTTNRCKMRFRRKRLPTADWDEVGERLVEVPDIHPDHNPEEVARQTETRRAVWHAVGQLKDIYREVIVLRYGQELSYNEVAEALNVSVGTVKSRLNTAHRKLQDLLGGDDMGGQAAHRRKRRRDIAMILFALFSCRADCQSASQGYFQIRYRDDTRRADWQSASRGAHGGWRCKAIETITHALSSLLRILRVTVAQNSWTSESVCLSFT